MTAPMSSPKNFPPTGRKATRKKDTPPGQRLARLPGLETNLEINLETGKETNSAPDSAVGQATASARPSSPSSGPETAPQTGQHIGQHIGIDEAGRGCLAGPVVAAAVLFEPGFDFDLHLHGIGDSKALTEKKRNTLAPAIRRNALAYAVGMAWPAEIDEVNILGATFRAMSRAVFRLVRRMGHITPLPALIVDGNHPIPYSHWLAAWPRVTKSAFFPHPVPHLPEQLPVIGGDALVPAISAASILAKTCRDRLMERLDSVFPGYGLAAHKGYGTKEHLDALAKLGPSALHRHTFKKVRPEAEQSRLPWL